jgi:DNA-binding CsgD family transcriptional regulator
MTQPLVSPEQLDRVARWSSTVGHMLRTLTPRQWDGLWLVAAGMNNRQIAVELNLSENTIETHIGAILGKLAMPSRASQLAFILQNHLEVLNPPGQRRQASFQEWWVTHVPAAPARALPSPVKEPKVQRRPAKPLRAVR